MPNKFLIKKYTSNIQPHTLFFSTRFFVRSEYKKLYAAKVPLRKTGESCVLCMHNIICVPSWINWREKKEKKSVKSLYETCEVFFFLCVLFFIRKHIWWISGFMYELFWHVRKKYWCKYKIYKETLTEKYTSVLRKNKACESVSSFFCYRQRRRVIHQRFLFGRQAYLINIQHLVERTRKWYKRAKWKNYNIILIQRVVSSALRPFYIFFRLSCFSSSFRHVWKERPNVSQSK